MQSRAAGQQAQRPEFHLLPENVPVFQLWGQVQTQWRHGHAGPTGFDWQSLRQSPAVCRLPRRKRGGLLQGLEVMEQAWLQERARLAEQERAQRNNASPMSLNPAAD